MMGHQSTGPPSPGHTSSVWGGRGEWGALLEKTRMALLALQLGVDAHFPLSWGSSRPTRPTWQHPGCWLHCWGGQSCPSQAAAGTGGPSWALLSPPFQAAAPGALSAPSSRHSAGRLGASSAGHKFAPRTCSMGSQERVAAEPQWGHGSQGSQLPQGHVGRLWNILQELVGGVGGGV